VEASSAACAIVRANAKALGLGESTRIFHRDARKLGAAPEPERFDLVFLDPPYGKGFVPPSLKALRDGGWLSEDALLVIEEAAEAEIDVPEGFVALERRRFGDTQLLFASSL
jgi:16S rRNA (guanine966-N2)-methyltransferase